MKSSQQYFNISDDSDNERFSNKRNRNGHQQDQKTSKQSRSDKHNYQSFNQFQKLMESPNTYLALSESSDDDKSKRMANRYKKISKQSSKASKEQYDKPKQLNNHHGHTHHHTHHRDNQEPHEHKSHQKKQEYQQHHSHRKSSHDSKIEFQKNNIIQVENQVKSEQETIKESSIQYSSNNQIQKSPSDSTSTNIDDVSEQQQKITFTVHLNPFNSVLTPEEMKNLTFEDSRHYKVIGDTRIFYTRSGNLSQKIKEVHNSKEEQERLAFLEEKKKQQELKKAASEKSAETNKDQKMEDEEENFKDLFEYDKNNRYFQQEQKHQMTCRRCKQQGHFERMCMLEAKDVCNNCLGDHYARYCPQKICYSCSQFGHSSANCPKQNSQKCSRCQKPGHIKAECGAIFMNSFSKYKSNGTVFNGIEEEWKKTDDQKIKCLVCHKKGHLNCKNDYQKIRDDIYGNKFQERIQKLRRKEEEAKFQGKIINFHYPEDSESSYNDDSHLAPPSPALTESFEERKEKKRNSKKKQKRYEEEEDYHHHSHSHSKHNHSHHIHHSKHSSHRHHYSHHEDHNSNNNHHHHNDSHRHHKSDRYRGRYDDDIQIHVDNDKQYKLKKQIRKESKKYK